MPDCQPWCQFPSNSVRYEITFEKILEFVKIQDSHKKGKTTIILICGSADLLYFHKVYFLGSDLLLKDLNEELSKQEVAIANQSSPGAGG